MDVACFMTTDAVDATGAVTYRALDIMSCSVASLISDIGVGPERLVGLMADRTVEALNTPTYIV